MENNIEGINIVETGYSNESLTQAISAAQTFDDLFLVLRTAGRVVGSANKVYRADDLINRISEFKKGFDFQDEESKERLKRALSDEHVRKSLLHMITRSSGLQEKVAELIIK